MRILPINSVSYSNNRNFGRKINININNTVKHALIPAAVFAAMMHISAQTIKKENVQYEKSFVMDNTKYKMVYSNEGFENEEDAVSEIFFTSDGQNPLRLEQLIKYTDKNGKTEVCAEVSEEGKNVREITLPARIGKKLIDLYEGKTDLYVIPGVNTYSDLRK